MLRVVAYEGKCSVSHAKRLNYVFACTAQLDREPILLTVVYRTTCDSVISASELAAATLMLTVVCKMKNFS